MKRTTLLSIVLAGGFLAAGSPAFAQSAGAVTPDARDWFGGKADVLLLGRDNVDSSKFEEYRVVPEGMSMPLFTLQGSQKDKTYALFGQNVSQADQRYTGYAIVGGLGVSFDYNQTPHRMGNSGRTIMTELSPGYWGMNTTLRGALANVVNTTVPASARTYPFFADLYAPTVAAATVVDLESLRKRGSVEFDLGRNLPIDFTVSYMREVKSGSRGASGGTVRAYSDNVIEVPSSLNELTQDLGFRAAINRTWGNVHAAVNRNWYDNRQETLIIDNPLQPFDQPYRAASGGNPATGGTSRALFVNEPDNEAYTTSFGALLKLAHQTRVSGDVAMGRWTQDAQLYPYTIFSFGAKADGTIANTTSALPFQSLDGKINTTTVNFSFSSRPVDPLWLRARYRSYDLDNQTNPIVREGSFGRSPDRVWAPAIYGPLGYLTASPYGNTTRRFDLQASYDFDPVMIEGTYRNSQLERTYREALKGAESGGSIAAVIRSGDKLLFRGVFDKANRTASEIDPATRGLAADESERDSTRAHLDVELMPSDKVAFMVSYLRRNEDYPNRPLRIPGVAESTNGLLSAKYDSYTAEVDLTPGERAAIDVYYTYEKNLSLTRTGGAAAAAYPLTSALVSSEGSDKTDTFGANANLVLVPEQYASGAGKWVVNLNARRQKVDGLVDVSTAAVGQFDLQRAAYGGVQDITDYDDTTITTAVAELSYTPGASWDVVLGGMYEKYEFSDSASYASDLYPVNGAFYLKANSGSYKVKAVFAKVNYRF